MGVTVEVVVLKYKYQNQKVPGRKETVKPVLLARVFSLASPDNKPAPRAAQSQPGGNITMSFIWIQLPLMT